MEKHSINSDILDDLYVSDKSELNMDINQLLNLEPTQKGGGEFSDALLSDLQSLSQMSELDITKLVDVKQSGGGESTYNNDLLQDLMMSENTDLSVHLSEILNLKGGSKSSQSKDTKKYNDDMISFEDIFMAKRENEKAEITRENVDDFLNTFSLSSQLGTDFGH